MKLVAGTFNGTGQDLYICCGFIPDFVKVVNVEATDTFTLPWSIHNRSEEQLEGVRYGVAAGITGTVLTLGNGIQIFRGGTKMTLALQYNGVGNGEGSYLVRDALDYAKRDITTGSDPIDKWTLEVTGNRTGHFNNDVVGTFIGEGSQICIDGKWTSIAVCAAGQGSATIEVELNEAIASGVVQKITNMYDFKPLAVGSVAPAGFMIGDATTNVNDDLCFFEAGLYDN